MKKTWFIALFLMIVLLTSCAPAVDPSAEPTVAPTVEPTVEPTEVPTPIPTREITEYIQAASINDGLAECDSFVTGGNTLTMPNVFGHNMLFQQNKPIRVWGYAPAGEKLEIRLQNQETGETVSQLGALAAADNTFLVELPAMTASFTQYSLEILCGSQSKKYNNILIGELYVAAGQSNMQVWMGESVGYNDELKDAVNYPNLRYYDPPYEPLSGTNYPTLCQLSQAVTSTNWGIVSQKQFSHLTAVGYHFMKELYNLLNADGAEVPVGIMSVPYGGTRLMQWLPPSVLEEDTAYRRFVKANYKSYSDLKSGKATRVMSDACGFYVTKIAPIVNMNIAGMIWYQGCHDESYGASNYETGLQLLVSSWSKAFRFENDDIPFVTAQLAPLEYGVFTQPITTKVSFNVAYSNFVAKQPSTRAVVALYDQPLDYQYGDNAPVHTLNKTVIGKRFAYSMYGLLYNSSDKCAGCPLVAGVMLMGNKAVVSFTNTGTGLSTSDGMPVRGFTVGGENKMMYPAEAVINGDQVTLSSPYVDTIKYVTYAYTSMNMQANLVNSRGMAVVPFVYPAGNNSLTFYAQHDYTCFDLLTVWRYYTPTGEAADHQGKLVDLYEGENCSYELCDNAVSGKSLQVTGQGDFSLNIHLDYSGDQHQFGNFGTLSLCATKPITSLTLTKGSTVYTLKQIGSETVAGTDFVRYTYSLTEIKKGSLTVTGKSLPDRLDRIKIGFTGGGTVCLDDMKLGK